MKEWILLCTVAAFLILIRFILNKIGVFFQRESLFRQMKNGETLTAAVDFDADLFGMRYDESHSASLRRDFLNHPEGP